MQRLSVHCLPLQQSVLLRQKANISRQLSGASAAVGCETGATVGFETGAVVGFETGAAVGCVTGAIVGCETGDAVGLREPKHRLYHVHCRLSQQSVFTLHCP